MKVILTTVGGTFEYHGYEMYFCAENRTLIVYTPVRPDGLRGMQAVTILSEGDSVFTYGCGEDCELHHERECDDYCKSTHSLKSVELSADSAALVEEARKLEAEGLQLLEEATAEISAQSL